jgi:CubicO group peptidase (beta-lactamase class C family)
MTIRLKCVSAFALAIASPAAAVPQDFVQRVNRLVDQSYPANAPGAAVIVTEHGKVVYERGRGLADVEAKKPITPDTVFRLGSISKQFAAATLLQLVHEGKLSLDDPLSKFLPDYPQPGASATVRQLLSHTSGIQDYTEIPGWMVEANTNKAYTTEQLINVFKDKPAQFKPGAQWSYDNSGYILVGAVIEKVTGKPWYEVVDERIARPLKLATLRYGVDEPSIRNMAVGYEPSGDGKFKVAQKINMSVPGAAGALVGTVGDLATWANALHHGKVLDTASYQAMTTKTKTADGKLNPYGFGMAVDEIRGHPMIGHDGGIFGFVTSSIYVPEQDIFVAVFHNSVPPVASPDGVAAKIAMLAIGDPFPDFHEQPVNLKAVRHILGRYKVDGLDLERVFYSRGGKLFTKRSDAGEMEVFSAGGNRFFYKGGTIWFDVVKGNSGLVMKMYQNGSHAAQVAKRVGPVPLPPKPVNVPRAVLQRYVGSYSVGGDVAVVTLGESGLSVKLGAQPTLLLIPRSMTEFEVEKAGARMVFNGPESAPAKSLTIRQGGQTIEAPRKD